MSTSALYLYRMKQKEKKRKEREATKAKTIKQAALLGKNAWTIYNNVQTQKVNELLKLKTPKGDKAYTIDSEYLSWKRMFNPKKWFPPAGGRVALTDAGKKAVDKGDFEDIQGTETLWEDFPGKEFATKFYRETKGKIAKSVDDMTEEFELWRENPEALWEKPVSSDTLPITKEIDAGDQESINLKAKFLDWSQNQRLKHGVKPIGIDFEDIPNENIEDALDAQIINDELDINIVEAVKTKLVEGLNISENEAQVTAETFIEQGVNAKTAISAADKVIGKFGTGIKAGKTALDVYQLGETLKDPDSTYQEEIFATGRVAASAVSLMGPQGAAVGTAMHTTLTLLELLNEYA